MVAKKSSINDIAKYLKVAKSTVSFVIKGKAEAYRISKEQDQREIDLSGGMMNQNTEY